MIGIRNTLFWRLSWALFGLLLLLGGAGLFVAVYFYDRSNLQLEQVLAWGAAEAIANELRPLLQSESTYWDIQRAADRFMALNPQMSLYLLDTGGNVVGEFGGSSSLERSAVPTAPIRRFLGTTDRRELPIYNDDPRMPGVNSVFSAARIDIRGKAGYVYVTLHNDEYRRLASVFQTQWALRGSALALLCAVLTTAGAGAALFYILTSRFRNMTAIVAKLEQGDFAARVPESGNDECAVLGRTINKMAATIIESMNELEKRDTLRRELIADISHDLRGPVALISGFSEVMLDQDRSLTDESRQRCAIILRNTQSLSRLLTELFELAKLEAHEITPALAAFNASELLEGIVLDYETKAEQRGIRLEARVSQLPPVLADAAMIERVVRNLLENSLRYTPQGGSIQLCANRSNGKALLAVADTGVGISEEDLPFVFDRFFQVDEAASVQRKGLSGLGLAIVKKIVEAHGSEVRVRSAEQQGTIFEFELPLA